MTHKSSQEGARHPRGPHSEITGKERQCRPGALPLLGSQGGVSRVLWVHSLLVNLFF